MKSTLVKAHCVSKKQTTGWSKEYPLAHQIELQVPYDQSSIFYQLSGGTTINLNTINQEAADMFIIGNSYDIVIQPSEITPD